MPTRLKSTDLLTSELALVYPSHILSSRHNSYISLTFQCTLTHLPHATKLRSFQGFSHFHLKPSCFRTRARRFRVGLSGFALVPSLLTHSSRCLLIHELGKFDNVSWAEKIWREKYGLRLSRINTRHGWFFFVFSSLIIIQFLKGVYVLPLSWILSWH